MQPEAAPSMGTRKTLEFLRAKKVELLDVPFWKRGEPLLFVFEESIREKFRRFDPKPRASVCRIDTPLSFVFWVNSVAGVNVQGQVDYYAIDPATNEPVWVGRSLHDRHMQYTVIAHMLFKAADDLFPKTEA